MPTHPQRSCMTPCVIPQGRDSPEYQQNLEEERAQKCTYNVHDDKMCDSGEKKCNPVQRFSGLLAFIGRA